MGSTRRFEPTPEQRAMIERKIAEHIGRGSPDVSRRAAARAHALPLYLDWSACMALRPDGEIIWVDYDEPHRVQAVEHERGRNLGLFQGSRRDPDLRCLVPPRPPDAIDCPDCGGTGRMPFPAGSEHLADRVVCSCGGIGWLPATSGPRKDRHSTRRWTVVRALLLVTAIPAVLLSLSLFGHFPWSGLNCWRDEIDINSGRTRYTRHLLWVPVTGSVRDSALTRALSPEDLVGRSADWHPVVTLSPGLHHSPHYRYHGAIHQIRELEYCWEFGRLTPAARRETARHVLRLWRQAGGDSRAGAYIQSIWERTMDAEKKVETIDVGDSPMP